MQLRLGFYIIRHEHAMTTREQRQKPQGPYSAFDIANHPARLAEFVWAIQDLAIAQQNVNPAAQERLYKHLCNINSHRIMITHMMQVRNMQINRRRKLVYILKRLIEQKGTVACCCSAYSSSGNYPEKACHMEMLQMHLGFIEEIKTVAVSSIYPIINYIADLVAAVRTEVTTLCDTAPAPTTTPAGLSCSKKLQY